MSQFVIALAVLFAAVALAPPPAVADTAGASTTVGAKVNINTADVKSLMTLTGVGRSLAEKIVKYRDEHGQFKKPTDLRKVEGVGETLWEKNRDRIVVK
jgi:competence protein ComEA